LGDGTQVGACIHVDIYMCIYTHADSLHTDATAYMYIYWALTHQIHVYMSKCSSNCIQSSRVCIYMYMYMYKYTYVYAVESV